jgi:hypothetical protein
MKTVVMPDFIIGIIIQGPRVSRWGYGNIKTNLNKKSLSQKKLGNSTQYPSFL